MKIRYGASLTVPHPSVPYANVKPTLEVEVDCEEKDRDAVLAQLKLYVHSALGAATAQLQELVR